MSAIQQRLVDRVESATSLDTPADIWASVIEKPLRRSARLRSLLSGSAFGHPIHPALVAVPIGAFVGASALDLAGEHDGALRLIELGLLSAIPTAATGGSDWVYTTGAERRVGFIHAVSNWIALGTYAASWQMRRRGHQRTGAVTALVGGTVLATAGWLGGHLAYARGVGVDTTAFLVAADEWRDVAGEDEVLGSSLTRVDADGVSVVLIRRGEEIRAMDDRCSHRGGPLHEGTLDDGCIVCPWHDSSFRIDDGRVVDGPAVRPQRMWEVRRRYGRIEIRVPDETGSLRKNVV